MRQKSQPAVTPAQVFALMKKVLGVNSLVRAMKATHADMNKSLASLPPIIAWYFYHGGRVD